jgi:uncharacterized protein
MDKFLENKDRVIRAISISLIAVLVFLSLFLIVKTLSVMGFVKPQPYTNYISVRGVGEIVAVPDVATFTFSIEEMAQTSEEAQVLATTKMNSASELLKEKQIDSKDIKTLNYNVYPRYEWRGGVCNSFRCDSGESVLVGYTVSQTTEVKIRNTEITGELFAGLTKLGINNVSGLSFIVDDQDKIKAQARELAIQDSRENAKKIAKELGVKIVKVSSYSEEDQDMYPQNRFDYGMGGDMVLKEAIMAAPSIDLGENKIISTVHITYEIR